jgi:hypothetical protein
MSEVLAVARRTFSVIELSPSPSNADGPLQNGGSDGGAALLLMFCDFDSLSSGHRRGNCRKMDLNGWGCRHDYQDLSPIAGTN